MKRSYASATIVCAAFIVGIGGRLAWRNSHRASTPLHGRIADQGNKNPATSIIENTNLAASNPPAGVYLGKDNLLYVKYGTADPALQSFMRAVMSGNYDTSAKGRAIFLKICAACHQPDGMGKEGTAPPLAGSEWVLAAEGDRLVRIVLNGMKGPVQVKGHEWNLVMPPLRENLKDDEIAVVLSYVRSKVGGNQAGPIKPESVSTARNEVHPSPETVADLMKPTD